MRRRPHPLTRIKGLEGMCMLSKESCTKRYNTTKIARPAILTLMNISNFHEYLKLSMNISNFNNRP